MEICNNILRGFNDNYFSPFIKSAGKDFIKSLLQNNPLNRLGCLQNGVADIRNHKYVFINLYIFISTHSFFNYLQVV